MKPNIKVGATVRFLNAVGGGRVARITKDTAWVEDADGFEIPTALTECVVVEEGDTFVPKYKPPTFVYSKEVERRDATENEPKHRLRVEDFEDFEREPADIPTEPQRLPHTFLPAKGDLRAYLAFIPEEIQRLGQSHYDGYLINDSNYTLYYTISYQQAKEDKLIAHGVLYPDADYQLPKLYIEELNQIERICVHLLAIAENPGLFKGHKHRDIKVDARKWLRAGSFERNDFFDEGAYIFDITADSTKSEEEPKEQLSLGQQLHKHFAGGEDSPSKKQSNKAIKAKSALNEPLVIDLHIEELLDTTAGMTTADILSYQIGIFNKTMQAELSYTGRKIIFIHGKGDGVLRRKLIDELKYRYKHCSYQDASFQEYSYGATQVTIGNIKK